MAQTYLLHESTLGTLGVAFFPESSALVISIHICQQITISGGELQSSPVDLVGHLREFKLENVYRVASSFLSIGLKNNGLDETQAATVKIGSRHLNMAPRIIIYSAYLSEVLGRFGTRLVPCQDADPPVGGPSNDGKHQRHLAVATDSIPFVDQEQLARPRNQQHQDPQERSKLCP